MHKTKEVGFLHLFSKIPQKTLRLTQNFYTSLKTIELNF